MSTRQSARSSTRGKTNGGSIRGAPLAIVWWHRMEPPCEEDQVSPGREAVEEFESRLRRCASSQAFASDLGPFLIRASHVVRVETITVGGRRVTRKLRRKEHDENNDLPEIAKRCRAFRRDGPEAGA